MFHEKYLLQVKSNWGVTYNDAPTVTIDVPNTTQVIYDVALVHRLTGEENNGSHNIYVDVLDRFGNVLRNVRVVFENGTQPKEIVTLDKPLNEPGGNKPMFSQDTYAVQVLGSLPSAVVKNLHPRWGNEGSGNTQFHWSFYIIFVERVHSVDVTPEPEKPPSGMIEIPDAVWDSVKSELNDLFRQQLLLSNKTKALLDLLGKYD